MPRTQLTEALPQAPGLRNQAARTVARAVLANLGPSTSQWSLSIGRVSDRTATPTEQNTVHCHHFSSLPCLLSRHPRNRVLRCCSLHPTDSFIFATATLLETQSFSALRILYERLRPNKTAASSSHRTDTVLWSHPPFEPLYDNTPPLSLISGREMQFAALE